MGLIDYKGEEGDRYHRQRHPEIFGNPELIGAWSRYAKDVYFRRVRPQGRVLEVGAGLGHQIAAMKDGHEVFAVEPARIGREHCESLGLKTFGDIGHIPASVNFDAILLRHVLEHVPEPRRLLMDLKTRLAPGGELILILPVESPYRPAVPGDLDHHLFCWNRQSAANLLTDAGYGVVEIKLHWFNGRRIFLWVYRLFGLRAYGLAMRWLGRIRRCCEIIVFAKSEGA